MQPYYTLPLTLLTCKYIAKIMNMLATIIQPWVETREMHWDNTWKIFNFGCIFKHM